MVIGITSSDYLPSPCTLEMGKVEPEIPTLYVCYVLGATVVQNIMQMTICYLVFVLSVYTV